jgi:hypothetical protein
MTKQKEILISLAELQASLNTATSGDEWITGVTNKGKEINWVTCISMEASEMLDCFPWKHWKDIDMVSDINNFKIEYVDLWHFVISLMLASLAKDILKINSELPEDQQVEYDNAALITAAIARIEEVYTYEEFLELHKDDLNTITETHRTNSDNVDNLLQLLSDSLMRLPENLEIIYYIQYLLETYYSFSFNDMVNLYIGKNALNLVRSANGYKEGTYIKNWNMYDLDTVIEDNVVMFNYVSDLNDDVVLSLADAETWLSETYKRVIDHNTDKQD